MKTSVILQIQIVCLECPEFFAEGTEAERQGLGHVYKTGHRIAVEKTETYMEFPWWKIFWGWKE